jgi:hypothetical protein
VQKKNYSTLYSRVVSHRSTDNAITSLTSEIGRDPVLFGVYGRSYYFDNFDGLYRYVLWMFVEDLAVLELADGCGQSGRLKKAKKGGTLTREFLDPNSNKGGSVIGSEGEPI